MTTETESGQQQLATIDTPAGQVFLALIATMESDNGCNFTITQADVDDAVPHIQLMMRAGHFTGDLVAAQVDLDSDVWMAAGGEESEAQERFSQCQAAYAVVSDVLNRIFDRPYAGRLHIASTPKNRYRIVQDGRHVGDIEASDARVAGEQAVETYGCGVFDVSLIRGTDDSVEWEQP